MRRLAACALVVLLAGGCTPTEAIGWWFRDEAPRATEVAWCESRLDPAAVSPDGANHGLFQINRVHRRTFEEVTGEPWAAVLDPVQNARFARWLWERQGWEPWSCRP